MAVIGLSKPHYAVYANTSGTVSYANGGVLGKAVEVNLEIETSEDNNLYADDGIAETDRTFSNGTLTLSTDDLSQEVSKAILGLKEVALSEIEGVTDEDAKELIYDNEQETPYLGIGFIIKKRWAEKICGEASCCARRCFRCLLTQQRHRAKPSNGRSRS
ncbi:MAG: major tail protein [Anaerovoracaceae bacterium]